MTIYYVVEKQLDETNSWNGLRNITAYGINNNAVLTLFEIVSKSDENGNYFKSDQEEISDYIDEIIPNWDTDKITFTRL